MRLQSLLAMFFSLLEKGSSCFYRIIILSNICIFANVDFIKLLKIDICPNMEELNAVPIFLFTNVKQ